ncbi:MAG: hypothetical protein JWN48_1469 [Myxococcaceae bacterium]|nr:hypothetical protein [Myxococcaceae bacterium]
MSSRYDMYNNVHKGLRRTLSMLLVDAGSADVTAAEQAAIASRWQHTQTLLTAHHHHEDAFIGPHLQRLAPALFAQMEQSHRALELEVQALGVAAHELTLCLSSALPECARRFYRLLAGFVGRYLGHMADEEGAYNQVLQSAYSDAELAAIEGALVASIAPALMANFSSVMLPAMNPGERFELLQGMQLHAPPPAFSGMCALAEQVLDGAAWQALHGRLCASQGAVAHG